MGWWNDPIVSGTEVVTEGVEFWGNASLGRILTLQKELTLPFREDGYGSGDGDSV